MSGMTNVPELRPYPTLCTPHTVILTKVRTQSRALDFAKPGNSLRRRLGPGVRRDDGGWGKKTAKLIRLPFRQAIMPSVFGTGGASSVTCARKRAEPVRALDVTVQSSGRACDQVAGH